jgi:hypothetical protein
MVNGKELAAVLGVTPQTLSGCAKDGHYCAGHDVSQWKVYSPSGFVKGYDVPPEVLRDARSNGQAVQADQTHEAILSPPEALPEPFRANPQGVAKMANDTQVSHPEINLSGDVRDYAARVRRGVAVGLILGGTAVYLLTRPQVRGWLGRLAETLRPGPAILVVHVPTPPSLNSPSYFPVRAATVARPTPWS